MCLGRPDKVILHMMMNQGKNTNYKANVKLTVNPSMTEITVNMSCSSTVKKQTNFIFPALHVNILFLKSDSVL